MDSNSNIRDYKGEILVELDNLKNTCTDISIELPIKEKYEEIIELLDRVEPSLMFYGVYNAGKSSLLNSIFGEEKASVADIPETHEVTYYKWRNFYLVDTPGVNGPEADFAISKPELKKHNVIMFVIDDSDNFDSDFVAKEIVEIINSSKPLIIVLNNKQNSDEERFNLIRSKLYENISKAAKLKGIKNVVQKYEFIVVNSNMAYKGKSENKKLLLKASKIGQLEIMINEQLRKIDEIRILKNPLEISISLIDSLLKILNKRITQSDEGYFTLLLQEINESKNTTISNLQSLIRMEIRKYNELIYSSVINGNEIDGLVFELNNKLTSYINNGVKGFADECQLEFDSLINNPEVRLLISSLDNSFNYEAAVTKDIKVGKSSDNGNERVEGILASLIGIKMPPIMLPIPTPIPLSTPIIVAVIKGIITLFKRNDNDNDIEELQNQIDRANVEQRESMIKRMNAIQEARTQIGIQLHNQEKDTITCAIENINLVYNQATESLNRVMEKASRDMDEVIVAYSLLSKIKSSLMVIKGELI